MSGISTGVGLISGIDTASLIDQLIAIERRPVDNLEARVTSLDVQRTAFLSLAAQLLNLQNSILGFSKPSAFRRFNSPSTNEEVLTATANEDAVAGSHTFRVRSLVSNHALISRGFADADTSPVGAGTMTFEVGNGKVNQSTRLETLNGGEGIRPGVISITDRAGNTAEIDLLNAITIDDVLEAINSNTDTNVRASVTGVASAGATGDRIVIEDLTAADETTGNLIIEDPGEGTTAANLGILANTDTGRVDGEDLVRLSLSTPLSLLNDGNGIGRFRSGEDLKFSTTLGDFSVSLSSDLTDRLDTDLRALNSGNGVRLGTIRITNRQGESEEIDLSNARSVRDVIETIDANDISVSISVFAVNGDPRFLLTDNSGVSADDEDAPKLTVEDVTGFAAADLGLAGQADGNSIETGSIYRIETIGDVINAINYAPDNNSLVEASFSEDGNGITLRALGVGNSMTVTAGQSDDGAISTAAQDLGLLGAQGVSTYESRHLIAGLNTVLLQSLNGGQGVEVGEVRFTDRSGQSATVDLTTANTLADVIDIINMADAVSIIVSINSVGNGVTFRDETNADNPLVIEDVSGSLAEDLGIAGTFRDLDEQTVSGGNLQLQYISRQSLLADLNSGRGVGEGSFTITDSAGAVGTAHISSLFKTVGDVIDNINAAIPDTIEARINDTGDGIIIVDTAGGDFDLTIEDQDGGRTASDLRLDGTAGTDEDFIDGSFETRIEIGAADTLEDIARKINEADDRFAASVLNHGGSISPFSLSINSNVSGTRGELLIDSIGMDLGFTTLTQAQDAIVTIGDARSGNAVLVTSSTNTIEGIVAGVTLDLLSVSDEPVTVNVAQDVDGIVESIQGFVERYNEALDEMDRDTAFDSETYERGPLFGDSTLNVVRARLRRTMTRPVEGVDESASRPFTVGLRLIEGGRLEFDEERFREIYEQSPEKVERFFTTAETGFAAMMKDALEEITRDFDGLISRRNEVLSGQQELLNGRIESLNVLLDAKRARLEVEFVALESSLAAMQAQQSALAGLTQLTG